MSNVIKVDMYDYVYCSRKIKTLENKEVTLCKNLFFKTEVCSYKIMSFVRGSTKNEKDYYHEYESP